MQQDKKQHQESNYWGRLISKGNLKTQDCKLADQKTKIGRQPQPRNQFQIQHSKISRTHCVINYRGDTILLQNLSKNGTFKNNYRMKQKEQVNIQDGDQIWILHQQSVDISQTIGFVFQWTQKRRKQQQNKKQQNKTKLEQELKIKIRQIDQLLKEKKQSEDQNKILKKQISKRKDQIQELINDNKDNIQCGICSLITFYHVCLHPCGHWYCGDCLWDNINKEKRQTCPKCRRQITTAVKDNRFQYIISYYFKIHPQFKPQQPSNNIFTTKPINIKKMFELQKQKQQRQRQQRQRIQRIQRRRQRQRQRQRQRSRQRRQQSNRRRGN